MQLEDTNRSCLLCTLVLWLMKCCKCNFFWFPPFLCNPTCVILPCAHGSCVLTLLSPQMNSLGSSSKWPSYDSLPSNSSFLLSESEQTEDEADVFSEGEADSGIRKSMPDGERITLSGNYLELPAHSNQPDLRTKSNQPEHCPDETKRPGLASSGAATLGSSSATPADLAFAQKVSTL